jgi:thiol-disulfide isomerase/thioredoxin
MKQFFLFFITVSLVGCYSAEPHKTGKEGQPMPDFSILLTDSTTWITPNRLSTNKPMALFYFSPYCPFCKAQTEKILEDMNRLKDIKFYLISPFPMNEIKAYQNKYQLAKYPNIIMGMDTSTFIKEYFEIPGVPYWAIYNKNKKLSKSFVGNINSSQIKKAAEE